jgi:hypothetical protein
MPAANPVKPLAGMILKPQAGINLQRSITCRYNSESGTPHDAITVIAAFDTPVSLKFAADATLTGHAIAKCLLTLKTCFCCLKSEGPFNVKKMSSGAMPNHKPSIDTTFDP